MTIVIAGYKRDLSEELIYTDSPGFKDGLQLGPKEWSKAPTGIFIMADSAISSGNTTILNEFKKIYALKMNILQPRIAMAVRGFDEVQYSQDIAVAFAGNTLTAQHIINQMSYHLGALRVVLGKDGKNRVIKPCEPHGMEGVSFHPHDPHDFSGAHLLVDAEYIRDVAVHAYDLAVRAARRYKRDLNGWKSLFTDILVAFRCPSTKEFSMYKIFIGVEEIDGVSYPVPECTKIADGDLCVLGADWREEANAVAAQARVDFNEEHEALFRWMVTKIDEQTNSGNNYVARPAVLKVLNGAEDLRTLTTAPMLESQLFYDREHARERAKANDVMADSDDGVNII